MRIAPCVALVIVLVACSGNAAPTDAESTTTLIAVRPQITDLSFSSSSSTADVAPILVVRLVSETAFADTEFLPVVVRSHRGSAVTAQLRPTCETPSGAKIICDQVVFSLSPGNSLEDLEPLLTKLDAQVVSVGVAGEITVGTIQVFGGALEGALQDLRADPIVAAADYNHVLLPAVDTDERQLTGAVPTAGWLSRTSLRVLAGDTLTAEYAQPDGSRLTTTIILTQ